MIGGIIMNRIKELRENAGLSLKQLSKNVDIPISSLSAYERDKRKPKIETYRKLADFFNVSITYLLGWGANLSKIEEDVLSKQMSKHLSTSEDNLFENVPEIFNSMDNQSKFIIADAFDSLINIFVGTLVTAKNRQEGAKLAKNISSTLQSLDQKISNSFDETDESYSIYVKDIIQKLEEINKLNSRL